MILLKVTKKAGFHFHNRKHIFGETMGGRGQIDPPALLGLIYLF